MKNGPYELIIAPDNFPGKKYRNKYAYEHIVVYWKKTGIIPEKGYEIHHINGNHRDNKFINLKLITAHEHRLLHGKLNKVKKIIHKCDYCGNSHEIIARNYRFKKKKGQKYFFCSYRCQALKQHLLGGRLI